MESKTNTSASLVAACGLFCKNCRKFMKDKCPGCAGNSKAGWCKIRSCCMKKSIADCSMCDEFENPKSCLKYNNFIAKCFGFVSGTDRSKCIMAIKERGLEKFVAEMTIKGWQSIPVKKEL